MIPNKVKLIFMKFLKKILSLISSNLVKFKIDTGSDTNILSLIAVTKFNKKCYV